MSARIGCSPPPQVVVRSGGVDYTATIAREPCQYLLRVRLPENLPLGDAAVLISAGGISYRTEITIVPTRFGFFYESPTLANGRRMGLTRPAIAGSIITLRGTGMGRAKADDVRASIEDQVPTVVAAGPSSDPGVDEFRLRLPATLAFTGCYVPLEVTVGGDRVDALNLSIAQTNRPCRHPLDLTDEQLGILDAGRPLPTGMIDTESPTRWAFFSAYPEAVSWLVGPQRRRARYQCWMNTGEGAFAPSGGPDLGLDAGKVSVLNPAGETVPLYPATTPGPWTFLFSGGIDIPSFATTLQVPAIPQLLDSPSFQYGADQEISLRWDPTPYDPQDELTVTIGIPAVVKGVPGVAMFPSMSCIVPAGDGVRAIPIGALLLAAPEPIRGSWQAILYLTVAPRSGANPTFRFRLRNGVESSGYIRLPVVSQTYTIQLREASQ
ncbi:MAG: hypothetical protein HY820_22805 [Acidobacteria bacterium]|nr:hypothetical protein [Acidobacteriota bacterium]